jgi:hypothetical protein
LSSGVGALTRGSLADVSNLPGVDTPRARTLERIGAVLGDESTNELLRRGTTMSYDELVHYAIHHLDNADTDRD